MTNAARAWLPDAAMSDGTVERRVAALAADWSAKWIAGGGARPLGGFGPAPEAEQGDWLVLGDSLAVAAPGDARLALAGAMLGEPLGARALLPGDRRVADSLAAAALDDLSRRLAALFGFPDAAPFERASRLPPALAADAQCCVLAADADAPPIRILAAADLLVDLRRSCVAHVPDPVPLRPLAEALGRQQVSVAARVGGASLTVAELAQLAVGDVVLLGGDPTGELDLFIEGSGRRCGSCTLDEGASGGGGGGYRLKIVQPLGSPGTRS